MPHAKAAPAYAGDLWTWYAIDADTKLIISWLVGGHTLQEAEAFITDLHSRIASGHRPQITTDGFTAYFWPIAKSFAQVDYGRAYKVPGSSGGLFGIKKEPVIGDPDMSLMHTNYVERYNKTVRMSVKRYTRQADAFSKSLLKHRHAVALQTVYYNYIRPHQTLRKNGLHVTPAMAAGLTGEPFTLEQLARSIPP